MQQKLCTRNTTLFVENGQACGAGIPSQLPFRCHRCKEHERFHSLAALRAHLEYSHTYHTHPRHDLSLPNSRGHSYLDCVEDCRRATAETQTTKDAGTDTHSLGRGEHKLPFSSDPPPPEQCPEGPLSPEKGLVEGETVGTELLSAPVASVGQRLEGMMRTANSSMERRLLRLSSELAQTDTALLCERAHSHHLAQERQEVLERERALSRQVDAAVMVIATLRQQLSMSEHELERRKQEVMTIQTFLEAAAQHEMCGKVRLRRFIESLLRRIALAERLLEYYQSTPHEHYCTAHAEHPSTDIGAQRITKSRCSGEQLVSDEEQAPGRHSGWGVSRVSGERLGHQGWLQRSRSDGYEV